jgi:hypothetical protein
MATIDTTALFGRGENASFMYGIEGLSTVSNYLFMDFLLISMFLIVLFMLRNYEFRDGVLSSSVITWILSIILWISGFVDFARPVVCFSVVLLAIGMSYFKD